MRILLISGYHGGSHQAWADGYRQYSANHVDLLTLPARYWKWRMHGGAVTLARRFMDGLSSGRLAMPDLLLFTDMVDVTTFLALVRHACPTLPVILYMHENQLTYPLPGSPDTGPMRRQKGERDLHYAFVNFASMLAADRIYFNSKYHRSDIFDALPRYLRHFPEHNELATIPGLEAKSDVLPPGIDRDFLDSHRMEPGSDQAPLIIWNQRWEFDKDPAQFFDAVTELAVQGLDFELAVCGERFLAEPPEFASAKITLRDRVIHWGFAPRDYYASLLWRASITASTAIHEFFGISILEAICCQTYALLPRKLSYPELLPEKLHAKCLYDGRDEMVAKLRWAIENSAQAQNIAIHLSEVAADYDWRLIAPKYDAEFEGLA